MNAPVGTGTGYTCAWCGLWVTPGLGPHNCPVGSTQPAFTPAPTSSPHALDPVPVYCQIAAALERIAAALEKLTEKDAR